MGILRLIYFVIMIFCNAKGVVINSSYVKKTTVVCKEKGLTLTLSLTDPFDQGLASDSEFIYFEWFKKANSSHDGISIMHLSKGEDSKIKAERVTTFEFWGIQIHPVQFEDSGIYEAVLLDSSGEKQRKQVNVIIATPPILKSPALNVKNQKKGNKSEITCGEIQTLGTPPVELVFKAENGSTLNSSYHNGFLTLELDSKLDTGEFYCRIKETSPAMSCIPLTDLSKWDSVIKIDRTGKSVSSADMTGIIAGSAVAVLILVLFVIIVFLFKTHRSKKDSTYNAKREEAKKDAMICPNSIDSENEIEQENPPYLSSKTSSASPYMVTGIKLNDSNTSHYACAPTNRQLHQQRHKRAPVATTDDEESDMNFQHRSLGGAVSGNVQPPVPMKRNKHFTVSNEGLNLIENPDGIGESKNIGTTV